MYPCVIVPPITYHRSHNLRRDSSGVGVSDEAVNAFQDLKLRKRYRFIIYKMSDDLKEIGVEKTVENAEYNDFVKSLPANECRYCVYDFQYDTSGEGVRNKILFYVWSPDSSKIKQKMLYAASKDALRKKLDGIYTEIQCTDLSEVSHETVLDKVTRMTS
ncbi:cofilin [Rhizophlyctis rosea]|uniref:Cofilin n=1 Tax=Rhizophlyctis rosea TaxID=64517 RepID=A0AAD5SN18_9FUNG|nr:cofilin [Rhizophlyctis rosea]